LQRDATMAKVQPMARAVLVLMGFNMKNLIILVLLDKIFQFLAKLLG
jgi:hypothetical protein